MTSADSLLPLRWIKDELDAVIREARHALGEYAEQGAGDDAIVLCAQRLHQVHGILHMAQLYGPAMLSEEMEHVAIALKDGTVKHPEDASEVLMVAMAQLPDYLEKLQEGVTDTPLLVLTELNDLRAVREAPLLTEAAFFSPDHNQASLPEQVNGSPNPLMPALSQKVRAHYHKGLLDWYRGADPKIGVKRLHDVFKLVSENAHTAPVYSLFHVARAVMEGLFEGGIETGSALKSVIGKIDHMLKELIDSGETGLEEQDVREARTNLLYYLARAQSKNRLIRSIQSDYGLEQALPSEDELNQNRARLHSPGQALYASVGHVLEAEMVRVKDDLDLFIRSDRTDLSRLQELLAPLHKLADTLGVLGQGGLRARLLGQIQVIEEMVAGTAVAGDVELTEVASELLYVESSMSDLSVGQEAAAANDVYSLPQGEFLQLVEKTMYEAGQEMDRVKAAVESYVIDTASGDELENASKQLHRVAGALRMLDHTDAAAMAEQAEDYVVHRLSSGRAVVERDELDGFAELITGIELYMEELPRSDPDLERYLTVARNGLDRLSFASVAAPDADERLAEVIVLQDKVGVAEAPAELDEEEAEVRNEGLEDIDSEILEIFVEEAREELEALQEYYPRWKNNQDDKDSLVNVRRSFHTLKGSGRLVGAMTIGDFAWSIEHLLNQSIEKHIDVSPGLLSVVDEALEILPELVDCQESGNRPTCDFHSVQERANLVANGESLEVEEALVEVQEAAPVEELEVAPLPPISIEPELLEVFSRETRVHMDALKAFIDQCRSTQTGCRLRPDQVRECHTLKGSARVAGVHPIADISRALEKLSSSIANHGIWVNEETLSLFDDSLNCIAEILSVVNQPGEVLPDSGSWVERIETHEQSLMEKLAKEELPAIEQQETTETEEVEEPVSGPGVLPRTEPAVEADSDGELISIFTEEADELFDELESALQLWRQGRMDEGLLDGLQRTLHTLKGGARLSGLMPVGDLSHVLESLFSNVAENRMEGSAQALGLAERASDGLANQIEQVKRGESPAVAQDLIADIEDFISREPAKPIEAEAAVESEEPAPIQPVETPVQVFQPAARTVAEVAPAKPAAEERQEQVRVSSGLLDRLVNDAGEISIFRARLEQQNTELGFNLEELEQTVTRLHGQLRKLDIETEAQILHRYEREGEDSNSLAEFDPLEFDRFSTMQQLSRSLMETVNDLSNIGDTVASLQHESESLLLHQSRLSNDLQDGLLRTRMVRFSQIVPRLQRLVRQTGSSLGKSAEFEVSGVEGEMDRAILDRMISPLEHILRNAVSHGIEESKQRKKAGKSAAGKISLSLGREATDVVIVVADDGRGLNLKSIRERAVEKGLLDENARISDRDLIQFVLEPGFSTAKEVTQIAGRGVGMDVVTNEVKQLGGSLQIDSEPRKGTQFTIRLPFTLAISHAMLIQQGDDVYAMLHSGIEGVVRVSRDHLKDCYAGKQEGFSYAGRDYKVRYLGQLLGVSEPDLSKGKKWLPMLLVRAGDQRMALQVDGFIGNRQIVVKSVGTQLSTVRWISGGTVLSDGRVALILDVNALARMSAAQSFATPMVERAAERAPDITVMVVDDSITVRKVTSRLLARHNMGIVLAKDGADAVAQLQEQIPDVMLLDIEMPRMDGYELARHMRSSARLKHVPIIMITSRVGEKHRRRAMDLGVKRYLGKPYQEAELMDNIYAVLAEANA